MTGLLPLIECTQTRRLASPALRRSLSGVFRLNGMLTLADMNLITRRVKEGSRGAVPSRGRLWVKIGVRAFVACLAVLALSPASQAATDCDLTRGGTQICNCLTLGRNGFVGATCLTQTINLLNRRNAAGDGRHFTIHLADGAYPLFEAEFQDADGGRTGLPLITSSLTIRRDPSLPPGNTIIFRDPTTEDLFRIFYVDNSGRLTLIGLTIQGGKMVGLRALNLPGGGIFVQEQAELHLDNVVLKDNCAEGDGGAIFLASGPAAGNVSVTKSTFLQNESKNTSGGGISSVDRSRGDAITLSITDSTFLLNKAGGGQACGDGTGRGVNGGGINAETLDISNSKLFLNEAGLSGGGISAVSRLRITAGTEIAYNTAVDHGGGISLISNRLEISTDSLILVNGAPQCPDVSAAHSSICR